MSGEIAAITAKLIEEDAANEKERERLQKLIKRHERKLEKLRRMNGRDCLTRVFDAVCEAMPGTKYELSGPFGLGNERGVSLSRGPDERTYISFRDAEGPLVRMVDFESDNGLPENSIGRVNGLHRASVPLPEDLSDIIKIIEEDFAESRLRTFCGKN